VSRLPQTLHSLIVRGPHRANEGEIHFLTLSLPHPKLASLLPNLKSLELSNVSSHLSPFLGYLTQLEKLILHSPRDSALQGRDDRVLSHLTMLTELELGSPRGATHPPHPLDVSFLPASLQKLSLFGDGEFCRKGITGAVTVLRTKDFGIGTGSAEHLTHLTHLSLKLCSGHIPALLQTLPSLAHLVLLDIGCCFPSDEDMTEMVDIWREGQVEFLQALYRLKLTTLSFATLTRDTPLNVSRLPDSLVSLDIGGGSDAFSKLLGKIKVSGPPAQQLTRLRFLHIECDTVLLPGTSTTSVFPTILCK
jgi:hypothetical protein